MKDSSIAANPAASLTTKELPNSAAVLRSLWEDRFDAAELFGARERSRSLRALSRELELGNASALSRWMRVDAPRSHRIPLARIRQVAEFLGLDEHEYNALMMARLMEMKSDGNAGYDEVIALVHWFKYSYLKRRALSDSEAFVLNAFRAVQGGYPKGLARTDDERRALQLRFTELLVAAEAERRKAEPSIDALAEDTTEEDRAKEAARDKRLRHRANAERQRSTLLEVRERMLERARKAGPVNRRKSRGRGEAKAA